MRTRRSRTHPRGRHLPIHCLGSGRIRELVVQTALAYHSVFDDKSLAFLSPWGFRMLALLRTVVRLTKEKPGLFSSVYGRMINA